MSLTNVSISKKLRTHVSTFSIKYSWERYEPHYLPSYEFNSITVVLLQGLLRY